MANEFRVKNGLIVTNGDITHSDGNFTYTSATEVLNVAKIKTQIILEVDNDTASSISAGSAVYVSGDGTNPSVTPARADSSSTMPSVGIVTNNIGASSSGYVTINGVINISDTVIDDTLSDPGDVGKILYVSPTTAGNMTITKPTTSTHLIQNVGKIVGISGSNVKITISNTGRTNDVPNTISISGSITGSSIIKSGGTSSQFLKADGSVDSSSYSTTTGTVTSIDVSGGTTGLTFSGGAITSSGTITMTGTLDVDNGGTGQTSYTNGQLLIGNTTGNTLAKATLTAGNGIDVTNGAGSITIAAETASATNPGVVELATTAETTTGTDATRAVTPDGLKDGYQGSTNVTTLGTIATGTWSGTTIAVNKGGTGQTSYTNGQLLIGNTTGNTLAKATLTAGNGIDVTNGAGSITIAAETAQTTITSVLNTGLVIGRDSTDQIKFSTDNQIIFRVGNADGVTFKASGEIEATKFDGNLEGNADTASAVGVTPNDAAGSFINENNLIMFLPDGDSSSGSGNYRPESSTDFYYNPSTTVLTVPKVTSAFTGDVTGTATNATAITLGGHLINDVDIGTELVDTDDHIMSSGAIKAYVDANGGIASLAADSTPQLGGDLDVNGNSIVSTSNANINITPNGTGIVDISTALEVGTGTNPLNNGVVTIINDDVDTYPKTLLLMDNESDNTNGPVLTLYRNTASPANNDILGKIELNGEDASGNARAYGSIRQESTTVGDGSHDGTLFLNVAISGTQTDVIAVDGTGGYGGLTHTPSGIKTLGNVVGATSTANNGYITLLAVPHANFKAVKASIHITDSSSNEVQTQETIAHYDGLNANYSNYGIIFDGAAAIGAIEVDINSSNIRFRFKNTQGVTRNIAGSIHAVCHP